ncbi:prenyltransferase/squalene oxidase repeat-containing protein [Deinococcus sp. QL22]|uniref:prenyltransferase/squalene oxidase repeat-containing protein n=1 Tax=Deinococcus sp. QL22 TaxID=2939437 RepID=UPI002017C347|nr:prenyltransferase/squalene oxidase repeat-containing protein [Deinococcus sp. QL22]UQN09146.1 terpene cyclase/mutase family protein [Deinococcus sp. QL22]
MIEASEIALTRTAAERGLAYLLRCQHPAGSFTDFWLPVGTSDAWVTAYVGLALHAASGCTWLPDDRRVLADAAARRAARWLLDHQHQRGGWGYNAAVSADADSTAHALSLLARLKLDIPAQAVAFLHAHRVGDLGFRTYAWPAGATHPWTQPCPDVSAAALRSLHDLGALTQTQLRVAWVSMVGKWQRRDGLWTGYWWPNPAYPTGLALELWNSAGRPPLRWIPARWPVAEHAFDLAWYLHAETLLNGTCAGHVNLRTAQRTELSAHLLTMQTADGAWPSSPLLRVPPAHPTSGGVTLWGQDDRRIFTAASALRALVSGAPGLATPEFTLPVASRPRWPPSQPTTPPQLGQSPLNELLLQVAQAAGFPAAQAAEARALFGQLTRLSLRPPAPWPSRQLTGLSGGMPLEFSVTVGAGVRPALRYATEVSDP